VKLPADPQYRHRFPAEIISHVVWLYHVFSLSLRDVERLLAERGIWFPKSVSATSAVLFGSS
jgi:putative transposase